MSIEIVYKIAAIGMLMMVVSLILKKAEREDIALLANIAGLIIVLMLVINLIYDFFTSIRTVFNLQ